MVGLELRSTMQRIFTGICDLGGEELPGLGHVQKDRQCDRVWKLGPPKCLIIIPVLSYSQGLGEKVYTVQAKSALGISVVSECWRILSNRREKSDWSYFYVVSNSKASSGSKGQLMIRANGYLPNFKTSSRITTLLLSLYLSLENIPVSFRFLNYYDLNLALAITPTQ
jgi:hypothetical protein